jgi:hypothetical protein
MQKCRHFLVLLLAPLIISVGLNIFLYLELPKSPSGNVAGTAIDRIIQGGMGSLTILIGNPPSGGLTFPARSKFNVTIIISFWDPYSGSATYGFSFKLHECAAHGTFPEMPMDERSVTVQKDKDAMSARAAVTFNVTAPATQGVYIYRVAVGGLYEDEVEFPILAI